MRRLLCATAMILITHANGALAQIDVARLAAAYKAFDMGRNEGKGHSESVDSGKLGWGEGAVLQGYAQMWEATEIPTGSPRSARISSGSWPTRPILMGTDF